MSGPIIDKILTTPNPHSPALSRIATSARSAGRTSSAIPRPSIARFPPSSNALRSDASTTEKATASRVRTNSQSTAVKCTRGRKDLARSGDQSCRLQLPSTPRHRDLAALVRTGLRGCWTARTTTDLMRGILEGRKVVVLAEGGGKMRVAYAWMMELSHSLSIAYLVLFRSRNFHCPSHEIAKRHGKRRGSVHTDIRGRRLQSVMVSGCSQGETSIYMYLLQLQSFSTTQDLKTQPV